MDLNSTFLMIASQHEYFLADLQQETMLFASKFHTGRNAQFAEGNLRDVLLSNSQSVCSGANEALVPSGE